MTARPTTGGAAKKAGRRGNSKSQAEINLKSSEMVDVIQAGRNDDGPFDPDKEIRGKF